MTRSCLDNRHRDLSLILALLLVSLFGLAACQTPQPQLAPDPVLDSVLEADFYDWVNSCFAKSRIDQAEASFEWLEVTTMDESRIQLIRDPKSPGVVRGHVEFLEARPGDDIYSRWLTDRELACRNAIGSTDFLMETTAPDYFGQLKSIKKPLDLEAGVLVLHETIVVLRYGRPGLTFSADWFRGDSSDTAKWAERVSEELLARAERPQ